MQKRQRILFKNVIATLPLVTRKMFEVPYIPSEMHLTLPAVVKLFGVFADTSSSQTLLFSVASCNSTAVMKRRSSHRYLF